MDKNINEIVQIYLVALRIKTLILRMGIFKEMGYKFSKRIT